MQTTLRGRLRQGHPQIVGGFRPRRSSLAPFLVQYLLPLTLMAGLGVWVAHHAATFVQSLHLAAPAQVEWIEGALASSAPSHEESIIDRKLAGFTPEVRRWTESIHRWSGSYELPPVLVAIVMQIESCGDSRALSPAGARGLFQVMPYHFEKEENGFDPEVNAHRGLAYLHRALELGGGRIDLALAGYNGGHGQIGRDPSSWPEETRRYVYWGTGIWEDLEAGGSQSSTLAAWLEAGGARLCQAALASSLDG